MRLPGVKTSPLFCEQRHLRYDQRPNGTHNPGWSKDRHIAPGPFGGRNRLSHQDVRTLGNVGCSFLSSPRPVTILAHYSGGQGDQKSVRNAAAE